MWGQADLERSYGAEARSITALPVCVEVQALEWSRYGAPEEAARPLSWDDRRDGNDYVRLSDGTIVKLWSNGQQAPPRKGWKLVVFSGDAERGYDWTLYGIAPADLSKPN